MVLRNFSTDVMTASWDGPWIIRRMSSAYVTISRFGTLDIVSISPLIVMFQTVGPATDTCGHPLVTCFELAVSSILIKAFRFNRKSFMMRKMFDGHFCSLSLASIAGCHVLSKAPAMSSAT